MNAIPSNEGLASDVSSAETYAKLVANLRGCRAYPEATGAIAHIETHISHVFLTGKYAYKVKKPLSLGFLDFSTLEKRRFFCEEELRLNRRLAPELYLDVVPIAGSVESPKVGAPGTPIEYALRMVQFDPEAVLDRVLEREELTAAHVDQIAQIVADFHNGLAPVASDSAYGKPESVVAPVMQNFDQLEKVIGSPSDTELLTSLRRWTARHSERLLPLFARRRLEGKIRECHGDLHLGNMVLLNGRVRVFDCIEFNPNLRWCDVMAEIAFVTMDLMQRGRDDFAYRFLNQYLEISGDYDGLRVLRYYMVYRALVRAKVAAFRAEQPTLDPQMRQTLRADYSAYLAIAQRFAEAPKPALVILHGLSGSGKTTLSQAFVEQSGMVRVRSDVERKRMHGISALARSASVVAGGIYRDSAGEATYARLEELALCILEGCFSVAVDATFLQRWQRDRFRVAAIQADVHFAIASFQASDQTLYERVAQRTVRQADASEAGVEVLRYQIGTQQPLMADELLHALVLDTEKLNATDISSKAKEMMRTVGRLRIIHAMGR